MMISKYIEAKKFCRRWVSNEEANKFKIINERVLIETWLGRVLLIINYFVVRKLVHTTGDRFFPRYDTEASKYIVLLTWVVFAIITFISIVQLVIKNKVYTTDSKISYEKITYYKYRIINRLIRVFILVLFYMTLYQILFQVTMEEIDIKRTILWWIIVVNIVILIYLGFIVAKNYFKGVVLSSTLEEIVGDENYDLSSLKKKIEEKRSKINEINSSDLSITFNAIEDLMNIAENTGIIEKSSFISKTELITNVSHDLKTPLTSIINYIDLLKREDIEPESARDYVNVLDNKAQRLKVLIDDLFEASKAASGEMELNIEKIEIVQLLKQVLGENDERISNHGLSLRVNTPEEKVFIKGDGKRLYRVFENLISNIVKYSMENTRVYIDIIKEDECVKIVMKNIAAYELNFDVNEITERFKRADEARTSEGSGLGLAIAKSIVELHGGTFYIEVDGDLFKSIITLKCS